MGELTDMVLEGLLCQECGSYIDEDAEGEASGFPRTCADCREEAAEDAKKASARRGK